MSADIERLRAVGRAATTSPPAYLMTAWEYDGGPEGDGIVWAQGQVMGDPVAASVFPEVATFIATARNEWDALLDRLEAAEAKVARVEALAAQLATRGDMAQSNMRDPEMVADRAYYEGMRDALAISESDLRAALADEVTP